MNKKEKTVLIVALGDIISTVIKFFLGFYTGSLALLADAWHSLGDICTSLLVYVALVADRRAKNAPHPEEESNGDRPPVIRRGGWELRVSVIIGILLSFVAFGVLQKAIQSTSLNVQKPVPAMIAVMVLIFISYLRFQFESSVGKELKSPALVADAYHSRVDMYALSLVMMTLVGEVLGLSLDKWGALVIGFMILSVALKILYRSSRMLLQQSRETEPDFRSIEDSMVLVLLGTLSKESRRVQSIMNRYLHWNSPGKRRSFLRKTGIWVGACVLSLYLLTGFFTVNPTEVAIVERLGVPIQPDRPLDSGIHYALPKPFSRIRKVDVKSVQRLPVGYESRNRKDLILWTNVHYIQEYPMLTGDNSYLDVAANMHFHISNPERYLYGSEEPDKLLKTATARAFQTIIGSSQFFPLITDWRDELEHEVTRLTQEMIDTLDIGITVDHIYFRDIHPPVEVAPSFEDVVSAQEDLETFVEEARGYEMELIPDARGEAAIRTENAKAQRTQKIMSATGKTSAFKSLEYAIQRYRDVSMFRLRMEMLETALKKAKIYIVDRDSTQRPLDLLLNESGKTLSPVETGMLTDEPGGK